MGGARSDAIGEMRRAGRPGATGYPQAMHIEPHALAAIVL